LINYWRRRPQVSRWEVSDNNGRWLNGELLLCVSSRTKFCTTAIIRDDSKAKNG